MTGFIVKDIETGGSLFITSNFCYAVYSANAYSIHEKNKKPIGVYVEDKLIYSTDQKVSSFFEAEKFYFARYYLLHTAANDPKKPNVELILSFSNSYDEIIEAFEFYKASGYDALLILDNSTKECIKKKNKKPADNLYPHIIVLTTGKIKYRYCSNNFVEELLNSKSIASYDGDKIEMVKVIKPDTDKMTISIYKYFEPDETIPHSRYILYGEMEYECN